jgi:ribosome-associated translation inhibitor RaiA
MQKAFKAVRNLYVHLGFESLSQCTAASALPHQSRNFTPRSLQVFHRSKIQNVLNKLEAQLTRLKAKISLNNRIFRES